MFILEFVAWFVVGMTLVLAVVILLEIARLILHGVGWLLMMMAGG